MHEIFVHLFILFGTAIGREHTDYLFCLPGERIASNVP